MNISESIITGVVSGVITSAVIFLLINIFNKIVVPWYSSTIYKGIDISGTWEEKINYSIATDYLTIELTQSEQRITGTLTVVKKLHKSEDVSNKNLLLNGKFHNGYLVLHGTHQDRRMQSITTFLLKVASGGESLEGQSSWVDSNNGLISSRDSVLTRKAV